jgi:hypothetical protein
MRNNARPWTFIQLVDLFNPYLLDKSLVWPTAMPPSRVGHSSE